jgi:ADP-ribosylglycohydrolase
MGQTCAVAFELFSDGIPLSDALYQINSLSASSEANGAMMRATPIAAWWANHALSSPERTAKQAAKEAELDASLSHPSLAARHANAVYVYALTHLLLGTPPSEVIKLIEAYEVCPTVRQWIKESEKDWADLPSSQIAIGHVRHAFVRTLWFLRHSEIEYREAIWWTLMSGGDTDTNAAIVGGAVACYHPIPSEIKERVHAFDASKEGRWPMRPKEYVPQFAL